LWPGLGIKRWIVLLLLGAGGISVGLVNLWFFLHSRGVEWAAYLIWEPLPFWLRLTAPVLMGLLLFYVGILRIGRNLTAPLRGEHFNLADSLYERSRGRRGPRVVAIGGGTGMPGLLRGLVGYTHNITAIVTVADDGGSSGRLRRELGLLPPGDFRNNIAALVAG
jgi:hypothetical protein